MNEQQTVEKVCNESNEIVKQFHLDLNEFAFLANLLCFLRMDDGSEQQLVNADAFSKAIEETKRLFSMHTNRINYDPGQTASRWLDLVKVANAIIDLTDEPLRKPIFQMFNHQHTITSVFLAAFARSLNSRH